MRVHARSVLAALAALAVAGALPSASAARLPAGAALLPVIGFQEEGDPLARVNASAGAISSVGVDGVNLTRSGDAVDEPGEEALAQLARAHAEHLRAVLLIGNFDGSIEDFNESTAYALLGNERHVNAVAAQLAATVTREGWDGISIDLESLLPRDGVGLVAFVDALRDGLPPTDTVNVDVSNFTKASQYVAAGYDLSALGANADEITLMAYDQHGPWDGHPGPVGALSWTRAGLAIALHSISADKIDLGAAGYGYDWGPRESFQVSDARARELVAADDALARYKRGVGEWTATLSDGSTLWWSDARSYAQRAELALGEHLHGMAVWSLGLSDPIAPVAAQ